ncbi:tripartite tricarboxylate transporter TctB family protein [Frigidibacter sp. MR17.24]|uniref:tripartite tricarboxylate transporter TctB family protein n=1 Tax=Frigidibacter sp. MR17.24 TaxID=3127345 RepID=UPI003012BACD
MADRIFASVMLGVTALYGWYAVFGIRAPFQYDPLGPESWPRLLSLVAALCFAAILLRPGVASMGTGRPTWIKLGIMAVLLLGYAELLEPLGFVLATLGFGALAGRLLGAAWTRSLAFGAVAGVVGYVVCAGLLGLNLPAGPLPQF